MSLTSIIINDGLSDIKQNKNRYGVARILMELILAYRGVRDGSYETIKAGFIPDNYYVNIALQYAAKAGNKSLVAYFMANCPSRYWSNGLQGAAEGGHRDLVNFFIDQGVRNWQAGSYGARDGRHTDLMEFFRKKEEQSYRDKYTIKEIAKKAAKADRSTKRQRKNKKLII